MAETPERRDAFLREPQIAVLATNDPRGAPHAMPVWYLYEDGVFLISCHRRARKRANVERDPRVSLVVDRRTRPYYAVMVEGTAAVTRPPDEALRRRLVERYLQDEAAVRAYLERWDGSQSVILRVTPTRFVEYGTLG